MAASKSDGNERRGIQSIEVGGELLRALCRSGEPMTLSALARDAGIPAARAHPYLVSLGKIGLVEQDAASGRYELGLLALELGLTSLNRLDPVRLATPAMADLAERTGQATALAIWGTHGPTIIRFEHSSRPIHVNLRTGTVMSLVSTATGQVFAAYLPPKVTEALIREELARNATGSPDGAQPDWQGIETALAEVRRHGLARAVGNPIPGINAFSAPVFDHTRNIVLAITALGPSGVFDPDWDGPIARALLDAANAMSARLGYRAS